MGKIIKLSEIRDQNAARNGFRTWQQRYGDLFSIKTRVMDFNHLVLFQLAEAGDTSANLFNSLIIGFLGCPRDAEFDCLPIRMQSRVVDIHLFLADRIRFEMMFRLAWLSHFVGGNYPLFNLVTDFERIKAKCLQYPPLLADDHPLYGQYQELYERDKQVFIRRLMPSALEAFKLAFL